MSIETYMSLALLHPVHGYYASKMPLGESGDFITAPEIGQMFGELIGLWCIKVWHGMGAPRPFLLAELGPGRGLLMADALRAAKIAPDFLDALDLHFVETSEVLRGASAPRWKHPVLSPNGTQQSKNCRLSPRLSSPMNFSIVCRCAISFAARMAGMKGWSASMAKGIGASVLRRIRNPA